MTHGDITDIRITMARIEERQIAANEASEHRHNNLKMVVSTLATKDEVAANRKRIDALESNQNKAAWAIVAAWIAGVPVAIKALLVK